MKKSTILQKGAAALLSACLALSGASPCFAATTGLPGASKTVSGDVVTVKDYASNKPVVVQYEFHDAEGNVVAIGDEADFDETIAALKGQIADGEMASSKTGCFESDEDAKNGIAKINFDVVGKPLEQPGVDVIFVLDESGSMNMLCTGNTGTRKTASPCLCKDHYYRIPADCGFGNTEDVYIRLEDYGPKAFQPWSNLSASIVDQIKADYGLESLGISIWKPWDNHYVKNDDGGYDKIDYELEGGWSSPVGNDNGCFDRMMLEKSQANSFADMLLNTRADSRIAVVGFSDGATAYISDFTSDEATIDAALSNHTGHANTNYTAGLTSALEILENRTDASRQVYVVFITDGNPYPVESDGVAVSQQIKAAGATIYGVGINLGQSGTISAVSSPNKYRDCASVDDFNNYLAEILAEVAAPEYGMLTDQIGEGYELYVDAEHPITVDGVEYASLAGLPSTVTYDEGSKTFSWNLPSMCEEGARISFYCQLEESMRSQEALPGTHDTNGAAELAYRKLVMDENNKISQELTPTVVSMESPSVDVCKSELPASVTSDKMTNGDPTIMGQTVTKGDKIVYTITVTNDGTVDATDVVVRNPIPEYTKYVSAEDGGVYSAEDDNITWEIPQIAPGETVTLTFVVEVDADVEDDVVDIIPESFVWGWGTADDYVDTDPICEGNRLENPTPVPDPEPTPTPTPTPTPKPTTTTTTTTTTVRQPLPAAGDASAASSLVVALLAAGAGLAGIGAKGLGSRRRK